MGQVQQPSAVDQQQSLAQEADALADKGASLDEVKAWQKKNSASLLAQQQQAEAVSTAQALQPVSVKTQVSTISAATSVSQKDFLTHQAALDVARAQLHNQLLAQLNSTGQPVTSAQVTELEKKERQLFWQQHAQELQLQGQRIQVMAHATVNTLPAAPTAPRIPANASPQVTALMNLHFQLAQEEYGLKSQYADSNSQAALAAVQQWRQQNAIRLGQLRQLIQESSAKTN